MTLANKYLIGYDPFVKDDFVLPEKWCIKSQSRDQDYLINEFARSCGGGHWSNEDNHAKSNYLNISDGEYHRGSRTLDKDFTEITFEQFKKYVLKEPIEQSKSIEKWSVGSYFVIEKDGLYNISSSKRGDVCLIKKGNNFNFVNKKDTTNWSFDLRKGSSWFATKSEAEEFAKTLVEPGNHGNGILDAAQVKQPLKQVVHCKTQEEWGFVSNKIGYKFINKFELGNSDTINPVSKGCQSKSFFERHEEYQILSFQEWCDLNGYKMEKEVKFEVGDYVILENAGGWSYSTCNDGCLGLITKIGNFKPSTVTDYICSISGNILNSNNKDTTFRDIPIAFYHRKWIVRHATPEEISNHLISIGQIPSGEPLNTGIEPNKDGMFKYKQTMPGSSWSGGTIDNHLDAMIPTTGNCYNKKFSTSYIPVKLKMLLSVNDKELPMVNIIKTNTVKQLLNLE